MYRIASIDGGGLTIFGLDPFSFCEVGDEEEEVVVLETALEEALETESSEGFLVSDNGVSCDDLDSGGDGAETLEDLFEIESGGFLASTNSVLFESLDDLDFLDEVEEALLLLETAVEERRLEILGTHGFPTELAIGLLSFELCETLPKLLLMENA